MYPRSTTVRPYAEVRDCTQESRMQCLVCGVEAGPWMVLTLTTGRSDRDPDDVLIEMGVFALAAAVQSAS